MRQPGALAAAVLLALALGTAGCKPSSLTPFGIGTRDYSAGGENVNGDWVGKTATGGDFTFQVGNDTVSDLHLYHIAAGCTLPFEDTSGLVKVLDGGFTVEVFLDQGRFFATVTFTSDTTCTGTYLFEALPVGLQGGGCPANGSGTFVANKTP